MKKLFCILSVCAIVVVAFGGGEVVEVSKGEGNTAVITKTVETVETVPLAVLQERKAELETQLARLEARYLADKSALTNAIAKTQSAIVAASQ